MRGKYLVVFDSEGECHFTAASVIPRWYYTNIYLKDKNHEASVTLALDGDAN